MKIGIVLHPYGENNPAGLARTIFEFTKGMLEVDKRNEYILFVKNNPKSPPQFPGNNWKICALGGGILWLDKMKHALRADVYIFNTPVMPLFWSPPKSVVIALDFAYWYLSPHSIKGQVIKWATYFYNLFSLWKADGVIAISKATRDDTVRLFRIPQEKISVIYCGFKSMCALPEEKVSLPNKFLLFVGVIKPRKNVFNIVKAFCEFQKHHPDYFLVIVGSGGGAYYDAICRYIKMNRLNPKVIFPGFVTDNNLAYIYKRAEIFLFPTLIEGFGYPVLEAMDCGVPVITSNTSSLKEVGGNGSAFLVDPRDPSDIARAMRSIAEDPKLQNELMRRGIVQSKQFSWHKAGQELLAAIDTYAHK